MGVALSMLVLALLPRWAGAADLKGKVVAVSGSEVTITLELPLLPNPGDTVRISFEVPGAGEVALDGTWVVTEATPDRIVAKASAGNTSRPQAGQTALVTSASPRPRPTTEAPAGTPAPPAPAPPPTNTVAELLPQLRSGGVTRGAIGVGVAHVPPDALAEFGLREQRGALVTSVARNQPADKAGIEPGDIILEFNGTPVKNRDELASLVPGARPGTTVPVKVLRDKQEKTLSITVGELNLEEETSRTAELPSPPTALPPISPPSALTEPPAPSVPTYALRHAHQSFRKLLVVDATVILLPGRVTYQEVGLDAKPEHALSFPCSEFKGTQVRDLNRSEKNSIKDLGLREPVKLTLRASESLGQLFEERAAVEHLVQTLNTFCGKR